MINYCEFDATMTKLYNTNFVVGPAGVLQKYHKSHVWFTKVFDQPATPDLVIFDWQPQQQQQQHYSFGMFMCYDILFHSPGPELRAKGVDVFLYNAAIPIVGHLAFSAWSLRYNATLIAADSTLPKLQFNLCIVFYHCSLRFPRWCICSRISTA
jgi:predicted amidohydrolase